MSSKKKLMGGSPESHSLAEHGLTLLNQLLISFKVLKQLKSIRMTPTIEVGLTKYNNCINNGLDFSVLFMTLKVLTIRIHYSFTPHSDLVMVCSHSCPGAGWQRRGY